MAPPLTPDDLVSILTSTAAQADDGLLIEDGSGSVVVVNHALCELFGSAVNHADGFGRPAGDVFVRMSSRFDDPEGFLDGVSYLYLNAVPVHREPLHLSAGRLLERDFLPIRRQSETIGVLWVFRDPSRHAGTDTEQLRAYYERVLEALPAQLAIFSPTGTYEYVTPSAIRNADVRAWIVGKTDVEYGLRRGLPADVVELRRQRVLRAANSGEVSDFEEKFESADGDVRYFRRFVTPVRASDGHVTNVLGYGLDITEQRRAEQQLLQAQKIDAVGRLAGGIAHDFNNLLTVINGFTEGVRTSLGPGHPSVADLDTVLDAGYHAAELVRQLMAFSRQTVVERTLLSVDDVVKQAAPMIGRLMGERIQMEVAHGPGDKVANGDAAQLQQILMNLVVNARDAMTDGGTLAIRTGLVEVDRPRARTLGLEPATYIELVVKDTGVGMTDEVRNRMFEPFFTTKALGRGTGLGMSIVYGIVADWGGHVDVESLQGRGTTVRVLFPNCAQASPEPAVTSALGPVPGGTETILLAEDDQRILRLTQSFLVSLGYTTLVAVDGREALAVAEAHAGPIHLLLSDVVMPNMGGAELARTLQQVRPEVKVLFASGYVDNPAVKQAVHAQTAGFITKPFRMADLARRVRALLDSPQ